MQLNDTFSHHCDLFNQVEVVSHDLQVVSLVNLALDLEAFPERLHRVIQELPLIFVLCFEVWVQIAVLSFLIMDEAEKALVDSNL